MTARRREEEEGPGVMHKLEEGAGMARGAIRGGTGKGIMAGEEGVMGEAMGEVMEADTRQTNGRDNSICNPMIPLHPGHSLVN
jgi:hypothetical protein